MDDLFGDLRGPSALVARRAVAIARERCGCTARIERGKRDVSGHDRRDSALDRAFEWNEIGFAKCVCRHVDSWKLLVRIDRRASMTREMLGGSEHAFGLTRIDPS